MRAAAVSSLARFGSLVQDLRPRILVLLQRALHDNDDEVGPHGRPHGTPTSPLAAGGVSCAGPLQVRDRATLHLAELQGEAGSQDMQAAWDIPSRNLEQSLQSYLEASDQATPFHLVSARPARQPPPRIRVLNAAVVACRTPSPGRPPRSRRRTRRRRNRLHTRPR